MTAITEKAKVVHGVVLRPRVIIRPRTSVSAKTSSDRKSVVTAARRVIDTHREVFVALRDR